MRLGRAPGASPSGRYICLGGARIEPASTSSGGTIRRRRLWRAVGILALLLVALAAYALISDGDEASLNPIAQAATRTERASGGKTATRAIIRGQSLPRPIEIVGEGLFNGATNRSQITMTVTAVSGKNVDVEGIGDGSHFYLSSDQIESALPDGDEWIGFDASLGDSSETGAIATASPRGQLAMLRAVDDDIEELGDKVIRGVRTSGYRSSLDPNRVAGYLRDNGSAKAAEDYEQVTASSPSTIEIETWVDRDGLVRRTTLTSESEGTGAADEFSMEMTVDFYDYGIVPEIRLPDPGVVYDRTTAFRSEAGLTTGDSGG